MAPLWEVLSKLVTPEPNTRTKSHIWYWKDTKNHVLDAGSIISAEQAERRVLILENPNMRGESKITDTLYAGTCVQDVLSASSFRRSVSRGARGLKVLVAHRLLSI